MQSKVVFCTLIVVCFGLTGCLQNDGNGECADGTLDILTYDILALSDEMVDEFTETTGYCVNFIKEDDSGGILDKMMLTKDSPQADLMIGLDNTYLQTALENNLLTETSFKNNQNYNNISPQALESYSGSFAIPFDMGPVCLNYDERFVDGENISIPTSLWDLTSEEWRGNMTFPSPITSSPGRAFLVATIDYFENDDDADTDAFDWWKAIKENDAIFTSGWTESYETHYTGGYGEYTSGYIGDAHLTVSYCQSPGVEAFYAGNYTHSTSITIPKTTFQQIEYTGIINGANDIDAAEAFIDYLLSPEVNSNMPENNLMYSVLNNQSLPETDGYRYHSDIPEENSDIEISRINQEMSSWLDNWQSATD